MEREAREAGGRASIASKARAERAARTARAGATRQRTAARREWREPPEDRDSKPVRSLMPLRGRYAAPPGGLRWERLGRIALLVNSSEILTKSLPEASRSSFWSSWGSFWASLGSLWPFFFWCSVAATCRIGPDPPVIRPIIDGDLKSHLYRICINHLGRTHLTRLWGKKMQIPPMRKTT